jgi:hypothetical protein
MTLETNVVERGGLAAAGARERDDAAGIGWVHQMLRTRSMTGFAASAFEGGSRIAKEDFGVKRVEPMLRFDAVTAFADRLPEVFRVSHSRLRRLRRD